MAHVAIAKYQHVPAYRQALVDAGDIIAEAVPRDNFWSAGYLVDKLRTIRVQEWPGRNMLGLLHMAVRARFMRWPVPPSSFGADYVLEMHHVIQALLSTQPSPGVTVLVYSSTEQGRPIRAGLAMQEAHARRSMPKGAGE